MLQENNTTGTMGVKNVFLTSLISGALAGTFCDLVSFPLDTLKTRLQSQHGFLRSGGFKQLYKGLGPVMIGSAPSASLFFITYEGVKVIFQPRVPEQYHSIIHMSAASLGELVACFIRVPVEVTKQRRQAFLSDSHKLPLRTLYRGYGSTVIRDLPFGLIQMPLWEYFKLTWKHRVERECTPLEGAICGSVSVAISATITTPLDVAKTRIMLSNTTVEKDEIKISSMLSRVYRECGFKGYIDFYQEWVVLLLADLYFSQSTRLLGMFAFRFFHHNMTDALTNFTIYILFSAEYYTIAKEMRIYVTNLLTLWKSKN